MRYLFLFAIIGLCSCQQEKASEMIIYSTQINTVDDKNSQVEAIYIKNGIVRAVGSKKEIADYERPSVTILEVGNAFVIPGLIEGHGHFSGLGNMLQNLDFLQSKSWQDIVAEVKSSADESEDGAWIYGRGWHQDKWDKAPEYNLGTYPKHNDLSEISPDNPVILIHASGHSLFANAKAMEIAGITKETPDVGGGHIVRDENGEAIGVFEERAMGSIKTAYQEYLAKRTDSEIANSWNRSMELAMHACLSNGITSFQDAGAKFYELDRYKDMAANDEFKIRLWTMVRHSSDEMEGKLTNYKTIDAGNGFYTCNAIKTELDGALGSYGAWLLEPYNDKPNFTGQNTTSTEEVQAIALLARQHDMQLCVHSIGDRANRETLHIFYNTVRGSENRRWRIEHAQHVDPADLDRFLESGTIASIQAIHCTSDAPFVIDRLGEKRAKEGAYPWRSFIDHGIPIVNGTDVPVEDINPMANFYASVTRKRSDTYLEFFPEQAMTRLEALRSMTIDAAYAGFQEHQKGSLEVGKYADITILDNNLLTCSESQILKTKVLYTIVNGKVAYSN